MAEAIGIKYNAWARYEAGGSLPGAEIIEKICRAHSCSADWLLGLTDGREPKAAKPPTPAINLDELRATATQLAEESTALAGTIKKLKKML
jgi:transcriptional regulator with XRE-family HTH domain